MVVNYECIVDIFDLSPEIEEEFRGYLREHRISIIHSERLQTFLTAFTLWTPNLDPISNYLSKTGLITFVFWRSSNFPECGQIQYLPTDQKSYVYSGDIADDFLASHFPIWYEENTYNSDTSYDSYG